MIRKVFAPRCQGRGPRYATYWFVALLACSLTVTVFGKEQTLGSTSAISVHVVATPGISAAFPSTSPFTPFESVRCRLTILVQNRSSAPILLRRIDVEGDGYLHSVDGGASCNFDPPRIMADEVESSGDARHLQLSWSSGPHDPVTTTLSPLLTGSTVVDYQWLYEDSVLLPNDTLTRSWTWIPVRSDGELALDVSARVQYLGAGFRPTESVFLLDRTSPLPEPPHWCLAGTRPPQGEPDRAFLTFRRQHFWNETTDFRNAIVSTRSIMSAETALDETFTFRLLLQPGTTPLKTILPQVALDVKHAIRSQFLDAWFLGSDKGSLILSTRRRVTLQTDVTRFLATRLLENADAAPWQIPTNNRQPFDVQSGQYAPAFLKYVINYPLLTNDDGDDIAIEVPAMVLIDRLIDMDRELLDVRSDGTLVPRSPLGR